MSIVFKSDCLILAVVVSIGRICDLEYIYDYFWYYTCCTFSYSELSSENIYFVIFRDTFIFSCVNWSQLIVIKVLKEVAERWNTEGSL